MPFKNFADPDQLAVLTKALDVYCERRGILSKEEREDVASAVMVLFSRGFTSAEEIAAGLERMGGRPPRFGRQISELEVPTALDYDSEPEKAAVEVGSGLSIANSRPLGILWRRPGP